MKTDTTKKPKERPKQITETRKQHTKHSRETKTQDVDVLLTALKRGKTIEEIEQ